VDKIAVFLVIVVSSNSCKLDNLDGAEVHRVPMESTEECEVVAEAIDARVEIRAYCEQPKEGHTND